MAHLDAEKKQSIAEGLAKVFASLKVTEGNLLAYSWNVVDPRFRDLHKFFCESAKCMFCPLDKIAKRIRAFDFIVPAAPGEFLPISLISDHPGLTDGNVMLQNLAADGLILCRFVVEMISRCKSFNDEATAQILTELDVALGEVAWKVKAHLTFQPQGFDKVPGMESITVLNKPATVGLAGNRASGLYARQAAGSSLGAQREGQKA